MTDVAIVDRGISEVPIDVATSMGPTAKTLNLGENELRAPGNLQYFKAVETLILDKNGLEGLDGFPAMPSVTTLWFNKNRVADLVEFMDQITATFPNLAYLTAMGNPAAPPLVLMSEEDVAASRRYRLYVAYRLPKLQFLDAAPITPEERREAAATGQFMAVRKPKRAAAGAAAAVASPTTADAATLFFGAATTTTSASSSSSSSSAASSSTGAAAGGSGPSGAAAAAPGAPTAASPGGAAGSGGGDGGGGGGGGGGSDDAKRPSAYLNLGTTYYDGRHSEGNRFIVDKHL